MYGFFYQDLFGGQYLNIAHFYEFIFQGEKIAVPIGADENANVFVFDQTFIAAHDALLHHRPRFIVIATTEIKDHEIGVSRFVLVAGIPCPKRACEIRSIRHAL